MLSEMVVTRGDPDLIIMALIHTSVPAFFVNHISCNISDGFKIVMQPECLFLLPNHLNASYNFQDWKESRDSRKDRTICILLNFSLVLRLQHVYILLSHLV